MYYPYFRGKQYELITVRENAQLMSDADFVPIIEPVKESLAGLKRAFDAVYDVKGRAVLVVNPYHGDHSDDAAAIEDYAVKLAGREGAIIGIVLNADLSVADALGICNRFSKQQIALIHNGFTHAGQLAIELGDKANEFIHIFIEARCPKLYRRHFKNPPRVLIRDGFRRRSNREYDVVEVFSDLHVTYPDENAEAFGDFLVVGDDFIEGGGPAYAVAIHLTFIDPAQDNMMYINHFKSDRSSTPQDPAGKFAEALDKLVVEVNRDGSHILPTSAVEEFLDLHRRGHFPGLGSVKKLSMNHHIQTMAKFLRGK